MLPDRPCGTSSTVELSIEADGRELFEEVVTGDPPGRALDLDLSGAERVILRVSSPERDAGCAWVCIADPRVD